MEMDKNQADNFKYSNRVLAVIANITTLISWACFYIGLVCALFKIGQQSYLLFFLLMIFLLGIASIMNASLKFYENIQRKQHGDILFMNSAYYGSHLYADSYKSSQNTNILAVVFGIFILGTLGLMMAR